MNDKRMEARFMNKYEAPEMELTPMMVSEDVAAPSGGITEDVAPFGI